jgi:hypothetical protein
MNRRAVAIFVFVLSAPCLARAEEDFCRDMWNKMTHAQHEEFTENAEKNGLTKVPSGFKPTVTDCLHSDRTMLIEELNALCAEGRSAGRPSMPGGGRAGVRGPRSALRKTLGQYTENPPRAPVLSRPPSSGKAVRRRS